MEDKLNNRFVIFTDFKEGEDSSPKRIKVSSIEEYYIDEKGILRVITTRGLNSFKYSTMEGTERMLAKLDALFNIRII